MGTGFGFQHYNYSILQSFFTALKIFCALRVLSSPTQIPGNHWSFYFLHNFAFSRMLCCSVSESWESRLSRRTSIRLAKTLMLVGLLSDSLRPHGLQHTRLPCPSPTPRSCSNSYPSSWWCHPTISSSVVPFSSYLQSFPASGSFLMSQLFASDGQSIGVSASASGRPVIIWGWFPLGLTDLISLHSKGLSKVLCVAFASGFFSFASCFFHSGSCI